MSEDKLRGADEDDDTWLLLYDGEVVAELEIDEVDQPWFLGRLRPRPGFAAMRDLSASDTKIDISEHSDAALTLLTPDGPAAAFWFQTDGDRVWLRWSEEPMDP